MGELVLGIHGGHNAAACIGDGHRIDYAMQEERLTGEKNYWGFPKRAIRDCLDFMGASPSDVAAVAYGSQMVLAHYHSREDVIRSYARQETPQGKVRQRVLMPLRLATKPDWHQESLDEPLAQLGLSHAARTHWDHHPAHAAAAYYGLRSDPDTRYLVLTADGSGDGACATVSVMGGGENREIARTPWANSLGALYSWVTYGYGFVPLEHEYKLMGMAPYASEDASRKVADIFRKYLWLDDNGLEFERSTLLRINDLWARISRDLRGLRFDHICGGLQLFTEDLMCAWVEAAVRRTGIHKVVAGGGVFMNVKANKRIGELDCIEYFEAFPSCGDETLAFGAYYLESAKRVGDEAIEPMRHYYLGSTIEDAEAKAAAEDSGFRFERPDDMAGDVADLLIAGEPIARAAGPMEYGARALGNRSILADPSNGDVVRVINQMVKKRDFWMPFAPMMLAERQHEYIENPKNLPSPYMMQTFDTKPGKAREMIAAVHNADLTCRPQILDEARNPDMYAILKAFEARTGRGVVLNTSFNLHGYPIVRTAKEAVDVLRNSGLNHLQVGPYLVHKT